MGLFFKSFGDSASICLEFVLVYFLDFILSIFKSVVALGYVMIFAVVLITMPIWAIPVFIYGRLTEKIN